MGTWDRAELEAAFAAYPERAAQAGRTGDWAAWADQFTDDALYVEHHCGRFEGREAIRSCITSCMSEFPGSAMPRFEAMVRGWLDARKAIRES